MRELLIGDPLRVWNERSVPPRRRRRQRLLGIVPILPLPPPLARMWTLGGTLAMSTGAERTEDRAALAAAVVDVFATLKRCLALVRLYHPDHDTVRDLAVQAGKKLTAILPPPATTTTTLAAFSAAFGDGIFGQAAPAPPVARSEPSSSVRAERIEIAVEAKSLSFHGKPILVDDGTETAVSTLFADGIAGLVFSPALSEDSVVRLVRLWGRASDKRAALPADQTFSTLLWEAGIPGVALVQRAEEVVAGDVAQQRELARRQSMIAQLIGAPPIAVPTTMAPLPAVDVDAVLQVLLTRTLQAIGSTSGPDRQTLLALCARSIAQSLAGDVGTARRRGAVAVVDALGAAFAQARAMIAAAPERKADIEALFGCLASDEVRVALVDAAAEGDADPLIQLLRFLPRRHVGVLVTTMARATPSIREALMTRLGEVNVQDTEWAGLVQATGEHGAAVVDVLAVARARSPVAAALVVDAARSLPEPVFAGLLAKLRGPEIEAARTTLYTALTLSGCAAVAEDLLVRLKDPAVMPMLQTRLSDETRPADVRKAAATALARLDGDGPRAALRVAFGSVKNDDVRAGIALALAAARDQRARPMLETIAKKLIVDRGLKKACEEAVKRLDAAAAAATGSS
jgi:hypothetical protein